MFIILITIIIAELLDRTQWLEEMSRRLLDLSEQLRDLTHSVQRCEDKLGSHDALGGASRDPKMLDRLRVCEKKYYFAFIECVYY